MGFNALSHKELEMTQGLNTDTETHTHTHTHTRVNLYIFETKLCPLETAYSCTLLLFFNTTYQHLPFGWIVLSIHI